MHNKMLVTNLTGNICILDIKILTMTSEFDLDWMGDPLNLNIGRKLDIE